MKHDVFRKKLRALPQLLFATSLLVTTTFALASANEKIAYQLPKGPLDATLQLISKQAGVTVDYDVTVVSKLTAPEINGILTANEALKQALAGSGLEAVVGEGAITIFHAAPKVASAEATSLDSVTVTGERKTKGNPQQPPTAVLRRGGKELEALHIEDIQDLQYVVPGLFVQSTESNDTQISIRGIGDGGGQTSGDQNIGMPSSVSVFVDNVYYPRPGIIRALTDIDYVDVFKGASGTTFGLNTTGGAIDIHTRAPSSTPEAAVGLSAAQRDTFKTTAMLSAPVNDVVSYRLNVLRAESHGNVKNLTDNNWVNGYQRNGARAQIQVKPDEKFQLNLSVDYANEYATPTSILNSVDSTSSFATISKSIGNQYVTGKRQVILDDVTKTHTEQGGASAVALWTFDNGNTIRSISSYRQYRYSPSLDDNLSVRIYTNSGTRVTDKDLSQDVRLESARGKWFDYVAGIGYFHQKQNTEAHTRYAKGSIVNTYAGSGSSGLDIIRFGSLNDEMYSTYFNSTFHVTDRLDFLAGFRETYEEKQGRFIRYNKANFDSGNLREYHLLPSFSASLKYRLTENWKPYVAYGNGRKSGGINTSAGAAKKAGYDSLMLRPESTTGIEAGVQGILIPNLVTLTADVFRSKVKNFQTQGYDEANQQTYLMNAGSFRSQGIEAGLGFTPLKDLKINLSMVINDARYVNYKSAICPPEVTGQTSCDLTGYRVFNAPKRIFVFDGSYDWNIFNDYKEYVSARYSYRSWTFGTVDDSVSDRIPGYGIASFSTGISRQSFSGTWDVSLWVNNAFNKLYYTRLVGSGAVVGYVGDPRTVGATFKYTY
ncbi:TonB-dependent receptor [Uliginosibacterium gangwonense]|uniref:TonB-dependent receptor n=1 Tax=Uliginosibacterium gangwonense TaxID=392736 RepID=UPI00039B8A78|nr:TonB-dependent receptor plug domain-containing protein [Uliginosibacterium gangwonense]